MASWDRDAHTVPLLVPRLRQSPGAAPGSTGQQEPLPPQVPEGGSREPRGEDGRPPSLCSTPRPSEAPRGALGPHPAGRGRSVRVKRLVLGRRALIPHFRCSLLEAQPRAGPLHAQRGRRGWDVLVAAEARGGQTGADLPAAFPGQGRPAPSARRAEQSGEASGWGGSRPQGHSETLTCLAAHPRSLREAWNPGSSPPTPRPGAERRVRRHRHEPGRGREGASPAGAGGQQGEGAGQGQGGGGGEHAHGGRARR